MSTSPVLNEPIRTSQSVGLYEHWVPHQSVGSYEQWVPHQSVGCPILNALFAFRVGNQQCQPAPF
jgi:hypothetical protein